VIWSPKKDQVVQVHYRKSAATSMPLHGHYGIVKSISKGPGPINVLVSVNVIDQMLDDYVIPRGSLLEVKE
jgi:hypothetical protein